MQVDWKYIPQSLGKVQRAHITSPSGGQIILSVMDDGDSGWEWYAAIPIQQDSKAFTYKTPTFLDGIETCERAAKEQATAAAEKMFQRFERRNLLLKLLSQQ